MFVLWLGKGFFPKRLSMKQISSSKSIKQLSRYTKGSEHIIQHTIGKFPEMLTKSDILYSMFIPVFQRQWPGLRIFGSFKVQISEGIQHHAIIKSLFAKNQKYEQRELLNHQRWKGVFRCANASSSASDFEGPGLPFVFYVLNLSWMVVWIVRFSSKIQKTGWVLLSFSGMVLFKLKLFL